MKERGNFLKSSQKKIRWRKDKGKKDKEKKKRKEKEKDKKKKKKAKRENNERRGRVRDTGGRRNKKGTTLPFTISSGGRNTSRQETKLVHATTATHGYQKLRVSSHSKRKGFSYTGYFLPSGHVRAILVQL